MLISKEYKKLNEELHNSPGGYGDKSWKWSGIVLQLLIGYNVYSMLDYGCGKNFLVKRLSKICGVFPEVNTKFRSYDPAVGKYSRQPSAARLVTCTDVMEHIEPEYLDMVLSNLNRLIQRVGFFVISLKESDKFLRDGRNAHLIVKSKEWWAKKFAEHMPDSEIRELNLFSKPNDFIFIAIKPRPVRHEERQ